MFFFPKIWVKSNNCLNHVYVSTHGAFISVGEPEEVRRSSEMDDPVLSIAYLSEVSIEHWNHFQRAALGRCQRSLPSVVISERLIDSLNPRHGPLYLITQ